MRLYANCPEQGNSLCPSFRALSPPNCISKHLRLVQQVGVPRATAGVYNDYNLCHHENQEDNNWCMHDQGLLGGYDCLPIAAPAGSSVNMLAGTKYEGTGTYTVARNLYDNSEWSIPDDFTRGPFAGTNPLWQGAPAPFGYLRIDEDEIGGHRMGAAVLLANKTNTISVMLLERLFMGTGGGKQFLNDAEVPSMPTQAWVPNLQVDMRAEDSQVQSLYQLSFPT
jgi:hypothetical protein